ncbi:MAG: DUF547 domain-containing protein [Elusimicrobia bacterium]|nr:DUF547 domain-containing protein [Elusimicrobiota bacterium]
MSIVFIALTAILAAAPVEAVGVAPGLEVVLKERVHEGRVDYAGLKKDRGGLDAWLASAAAVPEKEFDAWPREERLAFLINVYNATTLRLIVDHYPVSSIRKIGPFWDPEAPWHLPVVQLFGRTMTLNDLEQGIIRPKYKEPRVHFALVCAAKGCPPLRSEPYVGARLDAQLDDQARTFLGQKAKNDASPDGQTAYLSPIFKWYMADFGGSKAAVLTFVKKWLPVQAGWDVSWTDYDWSLNEDKR